MCEAEQGNRLPRRTLTFKGEFLTNKPSLGYSKGVKKEISHAASILGKIRTLKKSRASRENGKLGGRPTGKNLSKVQKMVSIKKSSSE